MKNICYSGGAEGSDQYWGKFAEKAGHKVIHYSFNGHSIIVSRNQLKILSKTELESADPYIAQASIQLVRNIPSNEYVKKLIRRNYFQVKKTRSVYAVSTLTSDTNSQARSRVEGGTAWAIEMAIDLKVPHIYLFDQDDKTWLKWDYLLIDKRTKWIRIDNPPVPEGKWTGIGTRKLSKRGKKAIKHLLKINGE